MYYILAICDTNIPTILIHPQVNYKYNSAMLSAMSVKSVKSIPLATGWFRKLTRKLEWPFYDNRRYFNCNSLEIRSCDKNYIQARNFPRTTRMRTYCALVKKLPKLADVLYRQYLYCFSVLLPSVFYLVGRGT